jgi:hypothetical protein
MAAAMDKALSVISDAFRPQRKGANQRMIELLRLKELVHGHRMTFTDALAALETQVDWIRDGVNWLVIDNGYLNRKHGSDRFHFRADEIAAIEWLDRVIGAA